MTLADFTPDELQELKKAAECKPLRKMLEARTSEILMREWNKVAVETADLIDLARAKGLYAGFASILNLSLAVDEEVQLREEEARKIEKAPKK